MPIRHKAAMKPVDPNTEVRQSLPSPVTLRKLRLDPWGLCANVGRPPGLVPWQGLYSLGCWKTRLFSVSPDDQHLSFHPHQISLHCHELSVSDTVMPVFLFITYNPILHILAEFDHHLKIAADEGQLQGWFRMILHIIPVTWQDVRSWPDSSIYIII